MQTPSGGGGEPTGQNGNPQSDNAVPLSQQETTRIVHEQIQSEAEAPVHSFLPHASPKAKRAQAERAIPADLLPDFRNLGNKRGGLHTELGTNDVNQIRQALTAAQKKPIAPVKTTHVRQPSSATTPRTPRTPSTASGTAPTTTTASSRIPEWYRVGWTAFSSTPNPGGPPLLAASEKKLDDPLEQAVATLFYNRWWNNTAAIFVIGIVFWCLGRIGGGFVTFGTGCLFVGKYLLGPYKIVHY